MHEDLATLGRVDALDRERTRRQREIDAQHKALADAEAALEDAKATLAASDQAVTDSTAEQKAEQRKLRDFRNSRANGLRLLETGQGDPEAAQRQVVRCDALIDESETRVLEFMDRIDTLQGTQQADSTAVELAEAAAQVLRDSVPPAVDALTAQKRTLTAERDTEFADLPADVAARYKGFRAKGRWAVSQVVNDLCVSCRMKVLSQQIADLRRGLILPCKGCHRWLIPPT